METKKQTILSIFHLYQEIYGRTYIQKLMFLLNKEVFEQKLFNYNNYKFGPYSSEVNAELSSLVNENFLEEIEEISKNTQNLGYKYKLTDKGIEEAKKSFETLDNDVKKSLSKYFEEFSDFCPTEILKYVYKKYPEVTTRSQFKM